MSGNYHIELKNVQKNLSGDDRREAIERFSISKDTYYEALKGKTRPDVQLWLIGRAKKNIAKEKALKERLKQELQEIREL